MTTTEIFQNETIPFGGRFQRELTSERVQASYQNIEERAQNLICAARLVLPNLPNIHFDFIFSGEINALAFRSNGGYYIGLNTGTLYMLRSVVGRLLSDSRLFQNIGDPNSERSDLGSLTGYVPNADEMYEREAVFTPNDPTRRMYATFLQDQAILFLVGHELTHIVHGHIDYLRNERGELFTSELGLRSERDDAECFERQCIETDADRRSIISRIDSLRVTFEGTDAPAVPWRPKEKYPSFVIFDWALSLNILFRLFGDLRFSRYELSQSAYPSFQLRLSMCEATAWAAVGGIWNSEYKPAALKALHAARNVAESAFATMLGKEIDPESAQSNISRHGSDHLAKIERYLNSKLNERLRPYSFEPLVVGPPA